MCLASTPEPGKGSGEDLYSSGGEGFSVTSPQTHSLCRQALWTVVVMIASVAMIATFPWECESGGEEDYDEVTSRLVQLNRANGCMEPASQDILVCPYLYEEHWEGRDYIINEYGDWQEIQTVD